MHGLRYGRTNTLVFCIHHHHHHYHHNSYNHHHLFTYNDHIVLNIHCDIVCLTAFCKCLLLDVLLQFQFAHYILSSFKINPILEISEYILSTYSGTYRLTHFSKTLYFVKSRLFSVYYSFLLVL